MIFEINKLHYDVSYIGKHQLVLSENNYYRSIAVVKLYLFDNYIIYPIDRTQQRRYTKVSINRRETFVS